MQAKFNFKIISVLLIFLLLIININCKSKKKADEAKNSEIQTSQNVEFQQRQLTAVDLLSMGLAELKSDNKNAIPEYTFNKALGFFYQVVSVYPKSFEAVEAQFNIAKFTEEKIKLINLREINLRQKQFQNIDAIRPFLLPYNPAINEYIEIYNKRENWKSFSAAQYNRARLLCTNALIQAAKLLTDETNSKIDYGKAIDIYKIIYQEFSDLNFGDFSLLSIVNIYFSQKEWQKVLEYGKIMNEIYPQSIYTVDVQNKVNRAKLNLK